MSKCAHCGKRILFGGVKSPDAIHCNKACAAAAQIPLFTEAMESASIKTTPVPMPTPRRSGPDDSMLVDRQGVKPGLVIAIGIITAVALSLGLHFAESSLDRQLRGLNFWIIIPIGAALNGAIISIGFFAAIRLLDAPPRLTTYLAACVSALLLSWLTFAIFYFTATDDQANPIRSTVSFTEFMQAIIESSQIRIGKRASSTVTAGTWGYALYAADCIGFMIGAGAMVYFAGLKPFCAKCDRFMSNLGSLSRSSDDAATAGATAGVAILHLRANNAQQAVETLSAFGVSGEKSNFGISLACHRCPSCGDYKAELSATIVAEKNRNQLLKTECSGNGEVRLK